MANVFALILVIATLISGVIWCINRFKWASKRYVKQANDQKLNSTLSEIPMPPKWIETVASVFPVLALVLIVRSFIFEPFQIPSGSMMPTLLIGDFILVKKFAYGMKDPIAQITLIPNGHPQRGDVVVFKYPQDPSINYIKRVIGLPGDKVLFNPYSKTITVHPECYNSKCNTIAPITYTDIKPSNFIQTFNGLDGNEIGNGFYQVPSGATMRGGLRLCTRKETIGNVTHDILLINELQSQASMYYHQSGQPPSTWVVPQGQYFMMGDNRDNSADSRYWGFVPEQNMVGKVVAIWMSFEKQEGQWPTGVRLSRIGGIL